MNNRALVIVAAFLCSFSSSYCGPSGDVDVLSPLTLEVPVCDFCSGLHFKNLNDRIFYHYLDCALQITNACENCKDATGAAKDRLQYHMQNCMTASNLDLSKAFGNFKAEELQQLKVMIAILAGFSVTTIGLFQAVDYLFPQKSRRAQLRRLARYKDIPSFSLNDYQVPVHRSHVRELTKIGVVSTVGVTFFYNVILKLLEETIESDNRRPMQLGKLDELLEDMNEEASA